VECQHDARSDRMTQRRVFVIVGLVTAALGVGQAGGASVRWYVVHQALSQRSQSLKVGDGVQTVDLSGGWSCSVGATSRELPLYEARETTCSNGDKSFKFSVQCESRLAKDHMQIRFTSSDGRMVDFIEVGCELGD